MTSMPSNRGRSAVLANAGRVDMQSTAIAGNPGGLDARLAAVRSHVGPRLVGAGVVVVLHIVFIYVLAAGLARHVIFVAHAPIETRIVDEAKPSAPEPPPLAQPTFSTPPPAFLPPPEAHIEAPTPPEPKRTATTGVAPQKPGGPATPAPVPTAAPPVPAAAPVSVQPRIDAGHSRQPEYPPASRQAGEEGTLILQALVSADGRVAATKLVQSSGFARLDQAALEGGKDNYRFVPGTVDGRPAEMWHTFRFTWKLR